MAGPTAWPAGITGSVHPGVTFLFLFFLGSFAIAWGLWFTASLTPAAGPRGLLILLGTFAPGLVALGLIARATGRPGVAASLRRLVDWQLPARWYLFALGYIAVIKLTAAVIHRVTAGEWPRFGEEPWYLMLAATVASTLSGGQAGEELGWRGYALPRLAARFGLGGASVLLGVLWACWHLPFFLLMPEADTFGQSFPLYLLQVTALSVAMAWLFARTRGSLLPVMLMHAAANNTKDIVPSAELGATDPWALSHSLVAWLTVVLLSLCAGWFLLRMRGTSIPAEGARTKPFQSHDEHFEAARDLFAALERAGHHEAAAELRDGFGCLNGLTDGWALFLESILRVQAQASGQFAPEHRQGLERLRAAAHAAVDRR